MKGRLHVLEDDLWFMECGWYAEAGIIALQHYLALWAEFGERHPE